ncbi:hypothetical protein LTR17_020231 [Elasticomyces elasticus]|nr:hypothetical protein LTR17_020231 [Elasticomyces elasticus]
MSGQRPLWPYGTGAFANNPNYPPMDARAYLSGAYYGPDRMVPQSNWPARFEAYTGMQAPLRPVEPGLPLYREYDQTYDGMVLRRFGGGPR